MRRPAVLLLLPLCLAASPAAARQDGPVLAYACFMEYGAEVSDARSDAGRVRPAAAQRRLSAYIASLGLDREADAAAVRAAYDLRRAAPDLRPACAAFLDTLPDGD